MSNAIAVNRLTRRLRRIGLLIVVSLGLLVALQAGALAVGGTATGANGHWGSARAVANGTWHVRSNGPVANGNWHVPAY